MKEIYLLAGSYAGPDQEGIQILRYDSETRTLERVSGLRGVENPSYVIADSTGRRAFAVSETGEGHVVALAIEGGNGLGQRAGGGTREGEPPGLVLREVNRLSSEGSAPCHLSLDEPRGWLHVVNYMSGEVCRYRVPAVRPGLSSLVGVVRHDGRGIRRDRQEQAHPHSIWNLPQPGGSSARVVVADLGMDALVVYDAEDEALTEVARVACRPGSGPRHVAFHPSGRWMYVANELSSSVSVYDLSEVGIGACVQEMGTLPQERDVAGPEDPSRDQTVADNTAADIHLHPSGRYLYVSNRGHDSIATYAVREDGMLDLVGHTSVQGRTPRNFVVLPTGDALLVANQDSDEIVVMGISGSGEPIPTGHTYRMSRPVCLQVVPR